MNEKEILEVLITYCEEKDGKKYLTCDIAHKLASDLKVELSIIGKLCNINKIKIKGCQLGCF
jgi:hypothetical protein